MSSVHRHPRSKFYYCAYYDNTGKHFKSTSTTNKREAERICAAWAAAGKLSKRQKLTPETARDIIEAGVDEILENSGHQSMRRTIAEHFNAWIKARKAVMKPSTFVRYEGIVRSFLDFLKEGAEQSLGGLHMQTVEKYRDEIADRVSPSTVNTHLKVIRVCLEKAVPHYLTTNPASHVENLDTSNRQQRRAFTMEELEKLLENASGEWKTMILFGLYTGLRLGDCASLCWNHIDLVRKEYTLTTAKTGRTQINPLAKPLLRHLEALSAGDDPKAPLCPSLRGKNSSWLSNQFFELMATAGLVTSRAVHTKKEDGRDKRRKLNEIGFHALRHTATSLLKNAGVSDVVARDLIGHESELISRNYTHIETATKRAAVDLMPDVMAGKPKAKQ